MLRVRIPAIAAILSVATLAFAVETKVLRDDSFADFNQGESTGTELLSIGRLRIVQRASRLEKLDEGVAWRVAVDPADKHVFYCTGHNGKVYHRTPDGKNELWADLPEVEAVSIAVDLTGGVLVGASPGGKIYRIVSADKPELFFETGEQYVWDMIFDRNGMLYAATGPNGKIFRIRGKNNGEVYCDSDATNIMSLAFDREGKLIAGTQGKAFVLRVMDTRKAYVLYAAEEDECRALAVDRRGNIYAAINSARMSSVLDRSSSPGMPSTPAGFGGSSTPSPTPTPVSGPPTMPFESHMMSLGGQSLVIQIQPSGFVSRFWQAPEGPIQCMMTEPGGNAVFVGCGNKGKIYRMLGDANYSVIDDVEEAAVMSFALAGSHLYFTTANKAALYEFSAVPAQQGLFASRPLNAGSTVQWGNILYEGDEPQGSEISFETRTGNTQQPEDRTWSPWAPAERVAPRLLKVASPVAQYLQYKAILRQKEGGEGPLLDSVQAFHIQKNAPPVIRSIGVEKVGDTSRQAMPSGMSMSMRSMQTSARQTPAVPSETPRVDPMQAAMMASMSSPPSGSSMSYRREESRDTGQAGAPAGVVQNSQKFNISWDASDPNGDRLQFTLSLKGEDETRWKELEKELASPRFTLATDSISDGKYRVKVDVTDALQNPEASASTVTLVSQMFVVDNTPPAVDEIKGEKAGVDEYEVRAAVADATSILSAAEYNVDNGKEWKSVLPEDGIFDMHNETFKFRVKPEKPKQEHSLTLRVYDREGNVRVAKVLLRQAP